MNNNIIVMNYKYYLHDTFQLEEPDFSNQTKIKRQKTTATLKLHTANIYSFI